MVNGTDYGAATSWNFLHAPDTSSLLGPNILSILFSNTLNRYSFLNVRDYKLHNHTEEEAKYRPIGY
jgi:hypothetical protein